MKFLKYILLLPFFLNAQMINFNGLEYRVIKSPITGKYWLDRNLGARQSCESMDDNLCFGDYYQWGRKSNGHEKLSNKVSSQIRLKEDLNNNGKYIVVNKSSTFDWRMQQNDKLWSNGKSLNNVCPKGYRLPSQEEISIETVDATKPHKVTNNKTAFTHFLKIPSSGFRTLCQGDVTKKGKNGSLWSSSPYERESFYLDFNSDEALMTTGSRAEGLPVRCIKN